MTPLQFTDKVFKEFESIHTVSHEAAFGFRFNGQIMPLRYRHAGGIVLAGSLDAYIKSWLIEMNLKDEEALNLASLVREFYNGWQDREIPDFTKSR